MSGINAFFWVLAVTTTVVVIGMATEAIVDWLKALAYAKSQSTREWLKSNATLDKATGRWLVTVPYQAARWNPNFLWDMDAEVSRKDDA